MLFMIDPLRCAFVFLVLFAELPCGPASAQTAPRTEATTVPLARQGISLAEKGRCREALPLLKKATLKTLEEQLKYQVGMAAVRCAMSLDQTETVVESLLLLRKDFPHDPQVLYITIHYYSELANRASRDLVATSPTSPQARRLEAEAFESQGKWDDAITEYNQVLQEFAQTPGVHYRLGRILLARPATPTTNEEAGREFEAELKIDPSNASAEFMLGEIARQAGQWDTAAEHFSRASKLDDGFSDALLALGVSFNSAGKFPEAVAPLERYTKLVPDDPAGHYQLAIAYARTGKKEAAAKEMALQQQTSDKSSSGTTSAQESAQSPR